MSFYNVNILVQGSTNCAHGDERARNVHVKSLSRAQNYVHVNQLKTHLTSTPTLFKVVSYFYVWKQLIFGTIRSDINNLFYLRSCCWI